MGPEELEQRLWNISNLLTGFSVVQGMAFIFSTAQSGFMDAVSREGVQTIVMAMIIVVSGFQSFALWWCYRRMSTVRSLFREKDDQSSDFRKFREATMRTVLFGRLALIGIFAGLSIGALFLRNYLAWMEMAV